MYMYTYRNYLFHIFFHMYIYIDVFETWYVTSYALFINHTGVSINGGYRKIVWFIFTRKSETQMDDLGVLPR